MQRRPLAIVVAVIIPIALVVAFVAVAHNGSSSPRKLSVASGGAKATLDAAGTTLAPAAYGGVTYQAGPDLPALTGKAHAYEVKGAADADAATRVAAAFGVQGTPETIDGGVVVRGDRLTVYVRSDAGGTFSVESNDGGGGSSSSVSSGTASPDAVCAKPEPNAPADQPCVPDTTVPVRPAGMPTEDAAKAQALDALRAVGIDVEHADVTVTDGITSWQVTVAPVVDGMKTSGLQTSVIVTERGIDYAFGYDGSIEQGDAYDLIGTAAAIDNLNAGKGFPFGIAPVQYGFGTAFAASGTSAASDVSGTTGTATAAPPPDRCAASPTDATPKCSVPSTSVIATPDSGCDANGVCSGSGYACPDIAVAPPDTTPPCLPPDGSTVPFPEPTPTVITLTDATVGLAAVPAGNGSTYLIPAYLFSTADGEGPVALAIDASWLEPVTPPTIEPATDGVRTDPGGAGTDGSTGTGTIEVPCSTPGAVGPCTITPMTGATPATPAAPGPPPTTAPPG